MELTSPHNDASFYEHIDEDYIDDLVRKELDSMRLDLLDDTDDADNQIFENFNFEKSNCGKRKSNLTRSFEQFYMCTA